MRDGAPAGAGAAATGCVVDLEGVGYRYPGTDHDVLASVDLHLDRGQHTAIVGRSGCGKSTLLSLTAGLLDPGAGSVVVQGSPDASVRLAACAIMPQGDSLLPWLSLLDNVAISLRNRGIRKGAARATAYEALRTWGLDHRAGSRPDQLSGGMRQRAALARALLADKPVLLADEPLGALDAITRAEGQQWLKTGISTSGATLLMVTHDVDEALAVSRRVILLAPPEPGAAATVVATWAGFFDDDRPRELLLGDPAFSETRRQVLVALAGHTSESGARR